MLTVFLFFRTTPLCLYLQPFMANVLSVAGSISAYKEPGAKPAGFWGGLWHGIIAPITFIISLFDDGVSIYETNNNGRWYEFGFMLGIGAYAGSEGVHEQMHGRVIQPPRSVAVGSFLPALFLFHRSFLAACKSLVAKP